MLHSPFPHVLPIHATLRSLCQLSDFSLFSVFFLISFAFPALSLSRLAPLTRLNSPLPRSWNHFPRCHPPNVNCGIGCFLGCFHLFPRVLPQQKQLEAPTTGLRVVVKRDGRSVVERKGALVLSFCACAPNLALDSRRFDVLFCRRSCQAANRQSCDDTRSTTPAAGETIARAPLPTINACVFRELTCDKACSQASQAAAAVNFTLITLASRPPVATPPTSRCKANSPSVATGNVQISWPNCFRSGCFPARPWVGGELPAGRTS